MHQLISRIAAVSIAVILFNGYNNNLADPGEFISREIAHRGLVSDAPENTASAIKAAVNRKLQYAEIDAQETKDGYVVLMHDKSLKRVAGINKCVENMNYDELRKVDVGVLRSKKFKGERIPTLENIIAVAKGKIKLDIEIKAYSREKELTEKVIKIIENNNFQDQCIITSFNYNVLEYVKNLDPKVKTSYIVYSKINNLPSRNIDIYSVEKDYVTPKLINEVHKNGKQIHVWTVNKKSEIRKFINLNVDYIITNKV